MSGDRQPGGRIWRVRRDSLLRACVLTGAALLISGCQSILEQSYEPNIAPSTSPQIVDEVQKNDPRAELGAREHPRIVASYGGEYHDLKTEQLVARITGALTVVSENPAQSIPHHHSQFPGDQRLRPARRLCLCDARASGAGDGRFGRAPRAQPRNGACDGQSRHRAPAARRGGGDRQRVVSEVLSSEIAGKQALARSKLRLALFPQSGTPSRRHRRAYARRSRL